MLQRGSFGPEVVALQVGLNKAMNANLVEDGRFGKLTQGVLIAFQKKAGITADGIDGPQTDAALAIALGTAPPSAPIYLNGIDVSHWDASSTFNFTKQKFVYLKATEGTSDVDATFATRRAQLKQLGIPCGAYHYLDPNEDGATQAQHFASIIGQLDPTDLPPALDFEDDANGTANATDLAARALNFLAELQKLTGRVPVVYTYPSFREQYCQVPSFANYPLWYSDLVSNAPTNLAPWKSWTFWQFNTTSLDMDYFNGDSNALAAFVKGSVVS